MRIRIVVVKARLSVVVVDDVGVLALRLGLGGATSSLLVSGETEHKPLNSLSSSFEWHDPLQYTSRRGYGGRL